MSIFTLLLVLGVAVNIVHGNNPVVECTTTQGIIAIEVFREWSPLGADRFLELVKDNFYTNIALFRCVRDFLVQFGISEDPSKKHWHNKNIKDDPNLNLGIHKHYVSFAGGGPNTRSTQLFIAFEELDFLGKEPWETPFGKVIAGEEALNNFYKGYGDIPPFGTGPDQQEIHREGNAYIHRLYPKTDFIKECRIAGSTEEVSDAILGGNVGDLVPESRPNSDNTASIGEQLKQLAALGEMEPIEEPAEETSFGDTKLRKNRDVDPNKAWENTTFFVIVVAISFFLFIQFILPHIIRPAGIKNH